MSEANGRLGGGFTFGAVRAENFIFGTPITSAGTISGAALVQTGTTIKLNPVTSTETMVRSGVSSTTNTRHLVITAMKEYENKSLEELRMEDYGENRGNAPSSQFITGVDGMFGDGRAGFLGSMHIACSVKFRPILSTDTMEDSEVSVNTRHQVITAMKEYESKSFEELRMEDYGENRDNEPSSRFITGVDGMFGDGRAGFLGSMHIACSVKFRPILSTDTMEDSEVSVNTRHQVITAMKEYESKSFEELRLEDYAVNKLCGSPFIPILFDPIRSLCSFASARTDTIVNDECSTATSAEAGDEDLTQQLRQKKLQMETSIEVDHLKDRILALETELKRLSTTDPKTDKASISLNRRPSSPLIGTGSRARRRRGQSAATCRPPMATPASAFTDYAAALTGSTDDHYTRRLAQEEYNFSSHPSDLTSIQSSLNSHRLKSLEDIDVAITALNFKSKSPSDLSSISDLNYSSSIGILNEDEDQDNTPPPQPGGVVLRRAGYYTIPSLEELEDVEDDDGGKCLNVDDLNIGRVGYGSIVFPGVTNLAGMNLDKIVHIRHKAITVYPNDIKKPAIGEGLNKKAEVTLERTWPTDKTSRKPITDVERLVAMNYKDKLRRATAKLGASFIGYRPESGSWVFQVQHFSKYILSEND